MAPVEELTPISNSSVASGSNPSSSEHATAMSPLDEATTTLVSEEAATAVSTTAGAVPTANNNNDNDNADIESNIRSEETPECKNSTTTPTFGMMETTATSPLNDHDADTESGAKMEAGGEEDLEDHETVEETSVLLVPLSSSSSSSSTSSSEALDSDKVADQVSPTFKPAATPTSPLVQSSNYDEWAEDPNDEVCEDPPLSSMSMWTMIGLLSTSFAYGCVLFTLFLITLPVECERMSRDFSGVPKSVALGVFVALAGVTQLISPLVGLMSDGFVPPTPPPSSTLEGRSGAEEAAPYRLGKRVPFHVLGTVLAVFGLFLQRIGSFQGWWLQYTFGFFLQMVGLNVMYAMMLALIPDQVPPHEVGIANGVLAYLVAEGSISGLVVFHFANDIQAMYGLYIFIVFIAGCMTVHAAHDRDAELMAKRLEQQKQPQGKTAPVNYDDEDFPEKIILQASVGDDAHTSSNTPQNNGLSYYGTYDTALEAMNPPIHSPYSASYPQKIKIIHTDDHHATSSDLHSILFHNPHTKLRIAQIYERCWQMPTRLLYSMLIEPMRERSLSDLARSYTIDRTQYHDFYVVTVSRLFYYCGMSAQAFFMYYLRDVIQREDPEKDTATLSIVGQISAAITAFPVGYLSDRHFSGQRLPFVYVACGMMALTILSASCTRTISELMVAVCLWGAANGIYLTMETSLAVETLPPGLEDGAQLLGVWGVAAFLGSTMGPVIAGPLLYIFGRQEVDDGEGGTTVLESYSTTGYAVVFSLDAVYMVLAAWSLMYLNKYHRGPSTAKHSLSAAPTTTTTTTTTPMSEAYPLLSSS